MTMRIEAMNSNYESATVRILIENQTRMLKLYQEDHEELELTKNALTKLHNDNQIMKSRITELDRERSSMLDAKQKADSERVAIVREYDKILKESEERRNRLQAESSVLKQQFHTSMERQAKSRQRMENEMVQIASQLDNERRKVMQLTAEKEQQRVALITLQEKYMTMERQAGRSSNDAGRQDRTE
ncbi:hypothetical protein VKS41_004340 [Umbelopsis sp. WA50703]